MELPKTEVGKFEVYRDALDLFSDSLYKDPNEALVEFFVNSKGASSDKIEIDISADSITITDNGTGFNDIKDFFRIGLRQTDPNKSGYFGIGRIASISLGDTFELISTKTEDNFAKKIGPFKWSEIDIILEDWRQPIVPIAKPFEHGAKIIISDLKTKIDLTKFKKLIRGELFSFENIQVKINGEIIKRKKLNIKNCKIYEIDDVLKIGSINGFIAYSPETIDKTYQGISLYVNGRKIGIDLRSQFDFAGKFSSGAGMSIRLYGDIKADGIKHYLNAGRNSFTKIDKPEFQEFIGYIENILKKINEYHRSLININREEALATELADRLSKAEKYLKAEGLSGQKKIGIKDKNGEDMSIEQKEKKKQQLTISNGENNEKRNPKKTKINKGIIKRIGKTGYSIRLDSMGEDNFESEIRDYGKEKYFVVNIDHPVYKNTKGEDKTVHVLKAFALNIAMEKGQGDAEKIYSIFDGVLKSMYK